MEGQDWASYQPDRPSTSGIDFTFIKATEGLSYINPNRATQTAQARTAGLVTGFYHYQRDHDPEKEAAYFVARCASVAGDPLACDWEDPSVSCAEKDAFIHEVKRLRPDHKVGLYCNLDFWLRRDTTSYCGDFLWIADPNNPKGSPHITHDWLIQQYSSKGGLDRNYIKRFTTRQQLKEFFAGKPVSAPAKPPATAPKPSVPAFPGRNHFVLGKSDSAVTLLGKQLVKKGFKKHNDGHNGYNPGPRFTKYDQANLRDFQLSKKELKGDADGYPGPVTWKLLFS